MLAGEYNRPYGNNIYISLNAGWDGEEGGTGATNIKLDDPVYGTDGVYLLNESYASSPNVDRSSSMFVPPTMKVIIAATVWLPQKPQPSPTTYFLSVRAEEPEEVRGMLFDYTRCTTLASDPSCSIAHALVP